jgi:hypothetical protein
LGRRVFFSFHYEKDIWRANQIRNSWVTKPDREAAGFWDASLWEKAKKTGAEEIKRMINKGLANTSVTVVLIGKETAKRKWVRYEIKRSYEKGNGLLGISLAWMSDEKGDSELLIWHDPFDFQFTDMRGKRINLCWEYPTYNWFWRDGYNNLGKWIEKAARQAGR